MKLHPNTHVYQDEQRMKVTSYSIMLKSKYKAQELAWTTT